MSDKKNFSNTHAKQYFGQLLLNKYICINNDCKYEGYDRIKTGGISSILIALLFGIPACFMIPILGIIIIISSFIGGLKIQYMCPKRKKKCKVEQVKLGKANSEKLTNQPAQDELN